MEMLEFKNTSIKLPGGSQSRPFSLVVNDGEVVCVTGSHGSGKSLLLKAVLGLWPVEMGFITFDGEIISPGSSAYFRNLFAYVPQDLPCGSMKVAELFTEVFSVESNRSDGVTKDRLLEAWRIMGVDKAVFDKSLDSVDRYTLQWVLLSFVTFMNKKIILIDNLVQTDAAHQLLKRWASNGCEVIFTCNANKIDCDKIVNI